MGFPRVETTSCGALQLAVADRDLQVSVADLCLECARSVLGDQEPPGDDADAVRQLVRLLQVLRGQEDRRAVAVQRLDLLPDRLAADRVEAGGRLVEEEDAGLVDERRSEVEPALHPARVGPDAPVGSVIEVDADRAAPRRASRPPRARAREGSPEGGSTRAPS